MSHLLTNIGEEYLIKNGLDSGTTTWSVGLYDDASVGTTGDSISDGDDTGAITTEPSNSNYSQQTDTFSPSDDTGTNNWGSDNDTTLSFDFSDQTSSQIVDSWFVVINFQSSETGDSSATDHLIATGPLSQERDIGSIDTLDISSGGVRIEAE